MGDLGLIPRDGSNQINGCFPIDQTEKTSPDKRKSRAKTEVTATMCFREHTLEQIAKGSEGTRCPS